MVFFFELVFNHRIKLLNPMATYEHPVKLITRKENKSWNSNCSQFSFVNNLKWKLRSVNYKW